MASINSDKVQEFYVLNIFLPATIFALVAFVLIVFQSFAWAFLVCCIYVSSTFYGLHALRYASAAFCQLNVISETFIPKKESEDLCGVCSNDTCKRHKLLPHSAKVKVPKDFDHALEELLEDLLQTYVCAWYTDFSLDEAFVQQLRLAIATAAKNVAIRLLRADVPSIVFRQLVPLALQHAEDWRNFNHGIARGDESAKTCFDRFSMVIHPAARSRRSELNYLRGLVTAVIPYLLPAIHVSTNNKVILREILANWILLPAVDALADPENVNVLVALSTRRDASLSDQPESASVPMLQCWLAHPSISRISRSQLKPLLDEVLNDPKLLYMFMQHVKETGPMNLFQFCLDIDDLSKRMLNPEMSADAEENLYTDIRSMFSIYLDPDGPEYLHLPPHISIGIQQILEGGAKRIQELRTSRPFYQAHQEAHALLEASCLPSFHHSYQSTRILLNDSVCPDYSAVGRKALLSDSKLYKLLCGQLDSDRSKLRASRGSVSGSSGGARVSSFSKIDGVLRSSAIDGAPFHIQEIYQGEEVDCPPRPYSDIKYSSARDLTTWRVSIPHVDSGGTQPLYMIAVHSVAEAKSWTVLRRDQDFYTLRTRLAEFHGDKELNDSPLPSRKNPQASCSTNRQRYEDFLEKLLSKPVLRSSELLFTFLTTPNLKACFATYSTPDIGILYQSMAYKLRKEKGQHLDRFMATFLASTNLKYEHTDVGVEMQGDANLHDEVQKKGRDLQGGVFGDNLGLKAEDKDFSQPSKKRSQIRGPLLCIADAVERLLSVPATFSRILWILGCSLRHKLDPLIESLLHSALAKLLSAGRAAIVVRLLHARITEERTRGKEHSTSKANEEHYEAAKKGLNGLLPGWLFPIRSQWDELTNSLLDPLQDPPLNKHLAYLLLDHVLVELFPELIV